MKNHLKSLLIPYPLIVTNLAFWCNSNVGLLIPYSLIVMHLAFWCNSNMWVYLFPIHPLSQTLASGVTVICGFTYSQFTHCHKPCLLE